MKRSRLGRRIFAGIISGVLLMGMGMPVTTQAAIKESSVFKDAYWEYAGEGSVIEGETGWLQSMCVTEDYIVCLENHEEGKNVPDTLIAFHRNDTDRDGNPVKKFSYATHETDFDYEHGNGMTYNPYTDEIIIAGYSGENTKKNEGCLFIADAKTLAYKKTVKVTQDRIVAVDFAEEFDQYVLSVRSGNDYKFVLADMDFNLTGVEFPMVREEKQYFQDFCVSGDYIIGLSFINTDDGHVNQMQVYSLSQKALLGTYGMQIGTQENYVEPESICELGQGNIMIGSALTNPSRIAFYKTKVASVYNVKTSVENGQVTNSQHQVDQGTDLNVTYIPDENYELNTLIVDGEKKDIKKYPEVYTIKNLQEDHEIEVIFTEIPLFEMSTSAVNGQIDENPTVRRDRNLKINFTPNIHYELGTVYVDGEPYEVADDAENVVLNNVQGPHDVRVVFDEIPKFKVSAVSVDRVTQVVQKYVPKAIRDLEFMPELEPQIGVVSELVYRDEGTTLQYQVPEDYEVVGLYADGKKITEINLDTQLSQYTFEDVTEAREVIVVCQWKYLPLVIWMSGWLLVWLTGSIYLHSTRKQKRIAVKKEAGNNEGV